MRCDWAIFDNFYSKNECQEIIDAVRNNKTNNFVDVAGPNKKVDTILVETEHVKFKINRFLNLVYKVNEDCFGFDLFDHHPWTINLNVYNKNNPEYPYHKDSSGNGSANDIKLTAIINLSQQKYSGGELQLFTGSDVTVSQFNKTGNVIIFPSFLYHRVLPILDGERITLSAWFSGKNFK